MKYHRFLLVLAFTAVACSAASVPEGQKPGGPNDAALEQVYLNCDAQVLGYDGNRACIAAHRALNAAGKVVTVDSVLQQMNK